MFRFAARLGKIYEDDHKLWGGLILLGKLRGQIRNYMAARMLNAEQLHLGPGCYLRGTKFITLGRGVYIHGNMWMEAIRQYREQQFRPKILIGNDVSFSNNVHISSVFRVTIGSGALIGSNVYISDHNHGSYRGPYQSNPDERPNARLLVGGDVEIGENVWIGDNVVIIGAVTIGSGAIVGANSVVKKDVPSGTIVAGIPARPIKRFDSANGAWITV